MSKAFGRVLLFAVHVVWFSLSMSLVVGHAAGAAELPDGRVYEEVSPVDKNGADVMPQPLRTRAASDGNAVQFVSFVGFGDVQGGSVATEYMAVRDPASGSWVTHGITPPQDPLAFSDAFFGGFDPRYLDEFSDDLSHGVYLTRSQLNEIPLPGNLASLYLRDDLLARGEGSYRLLMPGAVPQDAFARTRPWLAGASKTFDRIYFESQLDLTTNSTGLPSPTPECLTDGGVLTGGDCDATKPKLYEWVDGTVRLVGILPDGAPTLSQAGQGAELTGYAIGTVSRDGSRAVFTAAPFDDGQHGGALYVRDDRGTFDTSDDSTTPVNVSERSDCSNDPSCGGNGVPDPAPDPSNPGGVSRPATFWAASDDGRFVYFTTREQMTDDDVNESVDLYRADVNVSQGSRLVRVSVDDELLDNFENNIANGHDVSGVIGASADGTYVYFTVKNGQLVTGKPIGPTGGAIGGERIFVWHNGLLHEVGAVNGQDELEKILGSPSGWSATAAKWSRVTPDGTHMAFVTGGTNELLSLYGKPEASGDRREVYVYDATKDGGAGDLACASCTPTGAPASADADFYAFFTPGCVGSGTAHLPHVLSDDGRFVFFNTAERLQPSDRNDAVDAYEFDTASGDVRLLSGGTGRGDSVFLDASPDGRNAFFTTRDQLTVTDVDQSRDLYDARIGGRSPASPVAKPICSGEDCRPLPGPAVLPSQPGSVARRRDDVIEPAGAIPIFRVHALSSRQRRMWGRRGHTRLRVSVSQPGLITVGVWGVIRRHKEVVDLTTRKMKQSATASIPVRLTHQALRALADHGRLRVTITVGYSPSPRLQTFHVVLGV